MPEPHTLTIAPDILDAAANVIADAFGLGDSTVTTDAWPIEEGDTVIAATFSGDGSGRIFLAVNDEVAERLAGDPQRLGDGLRRAVDHVAAALGATCELGPVETTTDRPDATVELMDGNRLCALVGWSWDAAGDPQQAGTDPADAGSAGTDPAGTGRAAAGPATGEQATAPAVFTPDAFDGETGAGGMAAIGPLSLLQEVDMEVTVELGRTTMPIRELLALQPGMVVEIDRAAGAPIDVLVNGRLIACGEVVVIDEEFGIRITEIVGADA